MCGFIATLYPNEFLHSTSHSRDAKYLRSRSGTYFSGFTRLTAQFKARSTEKLNGLLQLDPHRRASSVRDLSRARDSPTLEAYKVRIEEELELALFRNKHKKYKEVTVPTSIKFSITRDSAQDSAVDMARPRSPSATGFSELCARGRKISPS